MVTSEISNFSPTPLITAARMTFLPGRPTTAARPSRATGTSPRREMHHRWAALPEAWLAIHDLSTIYFSAQNAPGRGAGQRPVDQGLRRPPRAIGPTEGHAVVTDSDRA